MAKWLKKYTTIKYLENILEKKEIHLSDPNIWPDKNDSQVIDIYKTKKNISNIRVTCLTMAEDRYHFWDIFGEKEKGVCLWFNMAKLIEDIEADVSLRAKRVEYFTPKRLKKECKISMLPFAKREQYKDEQEFRILRECDIEDNIDLQEGIKFRPKSLERIYFNSGLSNNDYRNEKLKAENFTKISFNHVDLLQNKTLSFAEWIKAAKNLNDD